MDRQLPALTRDENHHLEQVARAIWPDDEPAVWVLSGILDGECMIYSVSSVIVDNAVLASRRMNVHYA